MLLSDRRPGVDGVLDLADLDDGRFDGDVVLWDWQATPPSGWGPITSPDPPRAGGLAVPGAGSLLDSGMAVIGDVEKFVTAGDSRVRVRAIDGASAWSCSEPAGRDRHQAGPRAPATLEHCSRRPRPRLGVWELTVAVPARGWTTVLAG